MKERSKNMTVKTKSDEYFTVACEDLRVIIEALSDFRQREDVVRYGESNPMFVTKLERFFNELTLVKRRLWPYKSYVSEKPRMKTADDSKLSVLITSFSDMIEKFQMMLNPDTWGEGD